MFGFGGGPDYDNPADSAMPYLDQVPGTVSPYYQPYINWGMQAGNTLAPLYSGLATNPQNNYNDIMGGYTESPAYQYNYDQAMKQQQNAAASGGFTGTSYDQQRQAETTTGLLAQDQQQYYNNVWDEQKYGMQGEQGLFDTGYNASNTLANMLGQNLAAQAGLAYQGSAFENQMKAQQRANRNSLFGTTLGATLGYGGSRNHSNSNYNSGYSDPYADPYISGYSPHY